MFEKKLIVYVGTPLFRGPKLECLSVEEHDIRCYLGELRRCKGFLWLQSIARSHTNVV